MSLVTTYENTVNGLKNYWQNFDLKKWAESVGGSSAQAIQAAVFFGLCFAIGFLFKKYFRLIFLCIIVSTFVVLALHYNKLIAIDIPAVKKFLGFGVAESTDVNGVINHFFDWIRDNLLLFISSVVGFLVGYKLG